MLRRLITGLTFIALVMALLPLGTLQAQTTSAPTKVVVPGTHQSELGCSGDWQPDCDKSALTYDAQSDVWTGEFEITPGNDQDGKGARYKVALNGSWSENYGQKAQQGGSDIPLVVSAPTKVKFYYDHKTHWITDNYNILIVTAIGNFQSKLGCKADNDPTCLRAWLQDPEGDGQYAFTTTQLPAGTYQLNMAINEQTAEIYGENGQKGGAAIPFTVAKDGDEVYFGFDGATKTITISTEGAPRGSLGTAMAHWLTRDTIVWNVIGSPKYNYALHYDPSGAMTLGAKGIEGGQTISLTFTSAGPGEALLKKFPHLTGYSTLKLDAADVAKVPEILKGQIAVTARDQNGKLIDATSLQIPGVLDDLYTYNGPLGVTWDAGKPVLRVWAPTARSVRLHLYDDAASTTDAVIAMTRDDQSGVWTAAGDASWKGKYYLYEVDVYVRSTNKIEQNFVTDPYSFSLSMNSTRSQIVDLNDAALQPPDWTQLTKPALNAPEDAVIYELYVRDFSIFDETVPAAERGTFKAFTEFNSNGMKHLKRLAEAGLTHVHLLPVFDIATIEEDQAKREEPDYAQLAAFPGDSDRQQAVLEPLRDKDGYNWGYDPYHYTVPEGSYATDPNGSARIVEFRQMVQALNQTGLRVVMDVVYNHTNASGQSARSVLDKIVPGYYHRLNAKGEVETSTCCQNTATEHAMMEKLMIDSVVTWARDYKVDGFRFDIMGHHLLSNMVNVRKALDALTPDKDGVDGKSIYIYGEGWDFGEMAKNARGLNASQLNIGGTGIGVFNDRLRDAARGGGPFAPLPEQGFITGLFETPNDFEARSPADQAARLIEYHDWLRASLAGLVRDFPLQKANGDVVPAENIKYNGVPTAYTLDPQENINYVSAHDNETLFDAVQAKAPVSATLADRIAMNNLGIDLVMLSQGVPFFHAGDELLRSKSLDRNSYNSGDWFNRLDFTYQSNNWAVGLPPQGDNKDKWPLIQPLLADQALKPSGQDIQSALAHFETMLKIRQSSKLFRLETADQIKQHLSFLNTGPDQQLGLIVMRLSNTGPDRIADPYGEIVVLFNASAKEQTFTAAKLKNIPLELHPLLADSIKQAAFDQATGTFKVPARTTVVYVAAEQAQPTPAPTATNVPSTSVPPTAVPPTVQPVAQPTLTATEPSSGALPVVAVVGAVIAAIVGLIFMRRRK
ncbi:MAG: pullulanase-type alpha-1,6-glucosidase [Anaerolineae bacterium]